MNQTAMDRITMDRAKMNRATMSIQRGSPLKFTRKSTAFVLGLCALLGAAGCVGSSEPYRPPVDALVAENGGLQAKDVQAATDQMASDLLALPQLNASDHKWTIVVSDPTNQTTDPYSIQYNVFSNRFKVGFAEQKPGTGRAD